MSFSDREVLTVIALAFGAGFVFLLGLWWWHFLDNRARVDKLAEANEAAHEEITAALHSHNDRVMDHLIKIYQQVVGGKGR